MTVSKYESDLTNGSISRKLISLVIPLILSLLMTQMFSTADQIVVGRLVSNDALAAVGSTGPLIDMLIALSFGLSAGVTVACATHKGENDVEKVRRSIGSGILSAIFCGAVILVLGQALCVPLLRMTSTPEKIIGFSELYVRIVFAGIPFQIIYTFGAGILRSQGDTKRPMYLLFAGGLLNTVMNVVLVLLLPESLGDKRVIGVAIGTAASHILTATGVLVMLVKGDGVFRLEKSKLRFYKEQVEEMIKVGVPSGLASCAFTVAGMIVQTKINTFGPEAISAFVVSLNLYNYICHFISGFRLAVIPFVGQNYGSKKYDRIGKVVFKAIAYSCILVLSLGILMTLFSSQLIGIYTENENTIGYGVSIMRVVCLSFVIYAPGDLITAMFSGIDRNMSAMIIHLVAICGSRILWLYVFFPLYPTVTMLALAYTVSWILLTLITLPLMFVYLNKLKKCDPAQEPDKADPDGKD